MAGFGSAASTFLAGTPSGYNSISRLDPEQQQASKIGLRTGLGLLQNPSQGFEPIRKSATDYYNQQIVPGLAERFAGTGGAASSPSFASLLGQSGANFGSQLAGQEAQYAQGNMSNGFNLLQQGLQPYEDHYQQQQEGGLLQQLGPELRPLLSLLGRAGLAYGTSGVSEGAGGIMKLLQILNGLVNQQQG
jgi:hypothetical protein